MRWSVLRGLVRRRGVHGGAGGELVCRIPHYRSKRPGAAHEEVEVWQPRSNQEVQSWAEQNLAAAAAAAAAATGGGGVVVGFDVEWRPPFKAGAHNKVALVQLATTSSVMLVQLNRFPDFPEALADIIKSDRVVKVGVGVLEDLKLLKKDYGVAFSTFHDLGTAAKRLNQRVTAAGDDSQPLPATYGLQSMAKAFLGVDVAKPKRIRMGNWESRVLSSEQVVYAAYDALISRDVYTYLQDTGIMSEEHVDQFVGTLFRARGTGREQIRQVFSFGLESDEMRRRIASRLVETDDLWLSGGTATSSTSSAPASAGSGDVTSWRDSALILFSRLGLSPQFVTQRHQQDPTSNVTVHVVVDSRVIGSGRGPSKEAAVDQACRAIIEEILPLQRSSVSNDEDILGVYAGKEDRLPKRWAQYFASKPTLYSHPSSD